MNISNFLSDEYGSKEAEIEIPNVDRLDFAEWCEEWGLHTGVEIGTERGVYAKSFCTRAPSVKLYCVDPWEAYKGYREHVLQDRLDGFYEETKERLAGYNAELIRGYSVDVAKKFADESLDFVYIDGNHEFGHVVADLCAWVPKVKIGGIVAGHDFMERRNPAYLMGVVPAVRGFMYAYKFSPLYVLGRKDAPEGEKRDKNRTWMFVKTKNHLTQRSENGHS